MEAKVHSKQNDVVGNTDVHYAECGKLCGADHMTHLLMRMEILEGNLLDYIATHPSISLHQMIEDLDLQPCIISMTVGVLIRQGLVEATENENEVLLKTR